MNLAIIYSIFLCIVIVSESINITFTNKKGNVPLWLIAASLMEQGLFVIVNDRINMSLGSDNWLSASASGITNGTHVCLTTPWFAGCRSISGFEVKDAVGLLSANPLEIAMFTDPEPQPCLINAIKIHRQNISSGIIPIDEGIYDITSDVSDCTDWCICADVRTQSNCQVWSTIENQTQLIGFALIDHINSSSVYTYNHTECGTQHNILDPIESIGTYIPSSIASQGNTVEESDSFPGGNHCMEYFSYIREAFANQTINYPTDVFEQGWHFPVLSLYRGLSESIITVIVVVPIALIIVVLIICFSIRRSRIWLIRQWRWLIQRIGQTGRETSEESLERTPLEEAHHEEGPVRESPTEKISLEEVHYEEAN